ncbi:MAG: sialate O-acetylesterase [Planctomycetota bacterium]
MLRPTQESSPGPVARLSRIGATLALTAVGMAAADVRIDPLFSDNAVLQRMRPIPVEGRTGPNEKVTVVFGEVSASGRAGADGRFSVALPAMSHSWTPQALEVRSDTGVARAENILVGEVWFCSGQSNMEWPVDASDESAKAKEIASSLPIRSFKAPHRTANAPAETVPGEWRLASAQTVGGFTAVGFWFGVDLAKALGGQVPVGLVDVSWGGTRIEPWIPLDEMARSDFADRAAALSQAISAAKSTGADERAKAQAEEDARFARERDAWWDKALADDPGRRGVWSAPQKSADFPGGWRSATLPAFFPALDPALGGFDGAIWFTREFEVSRSLAAKPLTLELPAIDDCDRVWIDGTVVAGTVMDWSTPRRYTVPAMKEGVHRIAICVADMSGQGGFAQGAMRFVDPVTGKSIDLAGEWNWRQGGGVPRVPVPARRDLMREPGTEPHEPAAIYNAMVAPCIRFPARGTIWYQGESNAGEPDAYEKLLPLLIRSWRAKSGNPDLAWGVVQLAAFMPFVEAEPAQGGWALLRRAQERGVKAAGNAGLAPAIDLGDAGDIHPRRKREVGERLAAWARATVYGEQGLAWRGPEAVRVERENGSLVRVRFSDAEGLRATAGTPGGFALAGADGKFVWANATIMDEGRDGIVLSAPGVDDPVEVVYAWQNNPERANVVNAAGLPIVPFRKKVER